VAPQELLEQAERTPDPSQDYRGLFLTLSKNEKTEDKIELLLNFLASDLTFSSSDEELRKLMTNETMPLLLPYALNFSESSKRISPQTIFEVISTSLNRSSLTRNDLLSVLEIVRRQDAFDVSSRMNLFEAVCKQQNIDAEVAKAVLYYGELLRRENAQLESKIVVNVNSVVPKYLSSGSLLNDYTSFVRHLGNKETRFAITEDLLKHYQLTDNYLRVISSEALERGQNKFALMEMILNQSALTVGTLDQISIQLSNRAGSLSAQDKQVVALVQKHPLATDEMRQRLERALKGGWQPINPSDLDWNKR
jgi:hypothetical protein